MPAAISAVTKKPRLHMPCARFITRLPNCASMRSASRLRLISSSPARMPATNSVAEHQIGVRQPGNQRVAERRSNNGDEGREPRAHAVDPLRAESSATPASRSPCRSASARAGSRSRPRLTCTSGRRAEQRAQREGEQEEAGEDPVVRLDHFSRLYAGWAWCPARAVKAKLRITSGRPTAKAPA